MNFSNSQSAQAGRPVPIDIPNPQNSHAWQQLNPSLAAHHAAQNHHTAIWGNPRPQQYPYWVQPQTWTYQVSTQPSINAGGVMPPGWVSANTQVSSPKLPWIQQARDAGAGIVAYAQPSQGAYPALGWTQPQVFQQPHNGAWTYHCQNQGSQAWLR